MSDFDTGTPHTTPKQSVHAGKRAYSPSRRISAETKNSNYPPRPPSTPPAPHTSGTGSR